MKKKLFLAMMAIVAVFATLTFNACSSSDDDNNNGGGSGNGKAQVTAYVAIAQDQLNLFDVTVTFNGNAVQLTNSNTTVKELVVTNNPLTGEEIKHTFRVYDLSAQTITSFPTTYTVTAEAKIKEGIDITSQPTSDYSLSLVASAVDVNGGKASSGTLGYREGIKWSEATDNASINKLLKARTVTFSFDANGKLTK